MNADPIHASLDALVQAVGDPGDRIYARLFAQSPELEPMFVLDKSGSVRAEMLRLCWDAIIDLAGSGHTARGLISTELQNHAGQGITSAQFLSMFTTIRDVVRDSLGDQWTHDVDQAWRQVLERVEDLVRTAH